MPRKYKLHELSETRLTEVYNRWIDGIGDWWSELIIEQWAKDIGDKGYVVQSHQIYWKGFWSQGDGACFSGRVDLIEWIDATQQDPTEFFLLKELMISGEFDKEALIVNPNNQILPSAEVQNTWYYWDIVSSGPYAGLKLGDIEELILEQANKLEEALTKDARDSADDLYRRLEKEYEYVTSMEAFKEWAENDEAEFEDPYQDDEDDDTSGCVGNVEVSEARNGNGALHDGEGSTETGCSA